MLERVWRIARSVASATRVIVATDDERIFAFARGIGAEAVMTSDDCTNGTELELVAGLAATPGLRFVFEFPELVRSLLVRGEDFGVADAVRQRLWLSACGGGRSFSGTEVDPEYRYILEQGQALANRYRDDPPLHNFYSMVAQSERQNLEWHRRAFHDTEATD